MKISCSICQNLNCLIKKAGLDKSEHEALEKKHTLFCKKSQQFIIEGAPANGLFFVQSGKVKVSKTGINGREQILRLAKDGEVVGHRGFVVSSVYEVGAIALEESVLCNFTSHTLSEILLKKPEFTYELMVFFAEELNKSESKVKALAQMTVREKVIDALLYMARKFGHKDGYLRIQLSRKDIAGFAGTTEEQVIRVISSLKKEDLLIAEGKKLGIPDIELIRKEISEHNFYLDS